MLLDTGAEEKTKFQPRNDHVLGEDTLPYEIVEEKDLSNKGKEKAYDTPLKI